MANTGHIKIIFTHIFLILGSLSCTEGQQCTSTSVNNCVKSIKIFGFGLNPMPVLSDNQLQSMCTTFNNSYHPCINAFVDNCDMASKDQLLGEMAANTWWCETSMEDFKAIQSCIRKSSLNLNAIPSSCGHLPQTTCEGKINYHRCLYRVMLENCGLKAAQWYAEYNNRRLSKWADTSNCGLNTNSISDYTTFKACTPKVLYYDEGGCMSNLSKFGYAVNQAPRVMDENEWSEVCQIMKTDVYPCIDDVLVNCNPSTSYSQQGEKLANMWLCDESMQDFLKVQSTCIRTTSVTHCTLVGGQDCDSIMQFLVCRYGVLQKCSTAAAVWDAGYMLKKYHYFIKDFKCDMTIQRIDDASLAGQPCTSTLLFTIIITMILTSQG